MGSAEVRPRVIRRSRVITERVDHCLPALCIYHTLSNLWRHDYHKRRSEIGEQNRPTAQSSSANEYLYKRRKAVVVFAWLEGDCEPKRLEMLCRRIQIGMTPRWSLHRVRWSHPQFVSRHSRQFRNAFAVEIQIKHIALHHAAIFDGRIAKKKVT